MALPGISLNRLNISSNNVSSRIWPCITILLPKTFSEHTVSIYKLQILVDMNFCLFRLLTTVNVMSYNSFRWGVTQFFWLFWPTTFLGFDATIEWVPKLLLLYFSHFIAPTPFSVEMDCSVDAYLMSLNVTFFRCWTAACVTKFLLLFIVL